MPRITHDKVPSLRIELGKTLFARGQNDARGMLRYGVLSDSDISDGYGAGTPSTPAECGYLLRASRPACPIADVDCLDEMDMYGKEDDFEELRVGEMFEEMEMPSRRLRNVHVSSSGALAQLAESIDNADQASVQDLALKLIEASEVRGLMCGRSAFCIAATCLLAAQNALKAPLIAPEALASMGVLPRVICRTYDSLASAMTLDGDVLLTIMAAGGDVRSFPGPPSTSSEEPEERSGGAAASIEALAEVVNRGGSPLGSVLSTDESADSVPDAGLPIVSHGNTLGLPSAEEGMLTLPNFEYAFANGPEEENEMLLLPDFQYAFAYGEIEE